LTLTPSSEGGFHNQFLPLLTRYPWRQMPKKNGNKPTQETTPKKGPPAEIPIPTKGDFLRDLGKVAKPRKPPNDASEDAGLD